MKELVLLECVVCPLLLCPLFPTAEWLASVVLVICFWHVMNDIFSKILLTGILPTKSQEEDPV